MFDPVAASLAELRELGQQYEANEAVERYLRNRKRAYSAVFSGKGEEGDIEFVMLDLAHFCRAYSTTFSESHARMSNAEGRREVYLRILDHVSLDHDTLMQRYGTLNPRSRT